MSTKIKGAEYPLLKIFSSDFDYVIPSFQRPYAWTEEQAGDLFDDLYAFYEDESDDEQYFLGSIVLVKKDENKPASEVIDGQQRLTTLTILLAALTSKLSGEARNDFKEYIIGRGQVYSQGLAAKPRVSIRDRDNDFFRKYVQEMDFNGLFALDADAQDTEAKVNIAKNAKLLMERIEDKFHSEDEIIKFGSYLVTRCFLVVVSTTTRQAAVRIFSVMNSRGMSLLATDIIKADVIGAIREEWRDKYNNKWEEMEIEVGRDGFNELFGHIRMIRAKVKAKRALQDEFYQVIFSCSGNEIKEEAAISFIEETLEPYTEAYGVIKNITYSSTSGADAVNDILRWLNRLDNSDWIPVAMLCYVLHKDNAVLMNEFLRKLERLAAFMRATSMDVTHRIERYARILTELEECAANSTYGTEIELTEEEKKDFLGKLNSDIYKMTSKKRNYLILRLDSFVSDGAASYDSNVLTIEHVLPQTVAEGSQWAEWWPQKEEREKWVHKIGNLLPLSKKKNSQAQNYDFEMKKDKYFKGKTGVASYALTSQVLSYSKWTPEDVGARQEELIGVYKKGWEL